MLNKRMPLEYWFDEYQYTVKSNIGESAISSLKFSDLPASAKNLDNVAIRYGQHQGLTELREVIAQDYPGLTADDVIITTGAAEAIMIMSMTCKAGDRVIIEHPTYPTLYAVPRDLGVDTALFRLKVENNWKPDFKELESMLTGKEKYFAITHPNNPTGSTISEEEFRYVIELCNSKGVRTVSDETYRPMTDAPLPPAASLADNAVSIGTMSKTFGLPGLRIGWVATKDRDLIQDLMAIREHTTITNNTFGEYISKEVLKYPDPYLELAKQRVKENKEIVADFIEAHPRLDWVMPEAGVVCLPWIKDVTDEEAKRIYINLAENKETFVVPASGFEMPENYFRVGFGGDPEELQRGLEKLAESIKDFEDGKI